MKSRTGHETDPDRAEDLLDIEGLERLLRQRFPGSTSCFTRIEAGLGDRRFYRVELETRPAAAPSTLIARVEPRSAPSEPTANPFGWLAEPPLEPIRTRLEEAGLPVPRSYLHERESGVDLLEDLGSRTLATVTGKERDARYLEACDLIPRIQRITGSPASAPAFDRIFDARLVRTKAAKFLHWCWPGLLGREASPIERSAVESGFEQIADLLAGAPRRLSHRDFKAENLLLARRGESHQTLVMIDVQGAFMAPPEYDLVCLLRDMQVELCEDSVRELMNSTFAALGDSAAPDLARRRFEAIAVVRLAKDLAHVVHAGRSQGDFRRWHEIPNGLSLLEKSVEQFENLFHPARALSFVIHTLTRTALSSDIAVSRTGK